ncbi:MAG: DUF3857 domain-containing protein [Candidatus Omnitrophota bacterium]
MSIINTDKINQKSKIKNPKLRLLRPFGARNDRRKNLFGLLVMAFLLSSCAQKNGINCAREYARQAEGQYQRALKEYKELISKGNEPDKLYLRLGQLYYSHGEFEEAIEAFKESADPQAKKFLAVAYYRTGNFTDALEAFNRNEIDDEEYLYYYALTCEKLNLFEQALEAYTKIKKDKRFVSLAGGHIEAIQRQAGGIRHIKDLAPQISRIISAAPSAQNYPQAGALVLSCDESIEVTSEGTQEVSLHYLIKILNQRGKEDFSEAKIDYDSTYEKVELEYARTIKPDGQVAQVGTRHIRNVSKYMNFPLYSNARLFIISFPEVVEGSIIEYKLKVYRSQLLNKKDVVIAYPLQSSEPVLAAGFRVSLPQERKLNIRIINEKYNDFAAPVAPHIQENDSRIIYSWQFKDIPQIIPESNMPASVEINPTILLSTFNHWQEIYDWWWALARDKIKADKDIRNKTEELTKDKASAEEKIRAIYNFCAQKIRYVAVEYGQAGYQPHPAELIFKNKYGDCKDQAILLVTMLREAGIKSWPVLIATREYYNLRPEFPSVLFNHCIAALELEGKTIFLDPTAETCSFGDLPAGDQQRRVLLFKEGGYTIEEIPLYPAEHNFLKQALNIKVNSNEGIAAGREVFTRGFYDQAQRYWLSYTQPELIREALKEKIQDVSIGAKLLKYDIENLDDLNKPVALRYDFEGPEYFINAGVLRIMPQLAGVDTSLTAKDKRSYAIDFSLLESKENTFTIEIPANFVIKYIPESVSEDSLWMKLEFEYNHSGNQISFRQKSALKKRQVSEDEYAEFKGFLEGVAKRIKQRIILERKQ